MGSFILRPTLLSADCRARTRIPAHRSDSSHLHRAPSFVARGFRSAGGPRTNTAGPGNCGRRLAFLRFLASVREHAVAKDWLPGGIWDQVSDNPVLPPLSTLTPQILAEGPFVGVGRAFLCRFERARSSGLNRPTS